VQRIRDTHHVTDVTGDVAESTDLQSAQYIDGDPFEVPVELGVPVYGTPGSVSRSPSDGAAGALGRTGSRR
jgi:hypothetical protein